MEKAIVSEGCNTNEKLCFAYISKREEIDVCLKEIDESTIKINALVNENKVIIGKIEQLLKDKSKNKLKMTEKQINLFLDFKRKSKDFIKLMEKDIEDLERAACLKNVKNELILHDSDYNIILRGLRHYNIKQAKLIFFFKRYIDEGHLILKNMY